jgi:hypothetical protein
LTDHQLCELLKDPRRNGHRAIPQIVAHLHTPLVAWGWTPGAGRTPIPMSHRLFLKGAEEWAAKGGGCPAEKASSPQHARTDAGPRNDLGKVQVAQALSGH